MNSKYTLKALEDRRYSLGSKVVNTALSVGAMAGIKPAQRLLKKRATKFALRKAADGASGVIAAKSGVDKESVKELVHGVGGAIGASDKLAGSISRGTVVSDMQAKAKEARKNAQKIFSTGPNNSSITS